MIYHFISSIPSKWVFDILVFVVFVGWHLKVSLVTLHLDLMMGYSKENQLAAIKLPLVLLVKAEKL